MYLPLPCEYVPQIGRVWGASSKSKLSHLWEFRERFRNKYLFKQHMWLSTSQLPELIKLWNCQPYKRDRASYISPLPPTPPLLPVAGHGAALKEALSHPHYISWKLGAIFLVITNPKHAECRRSQGTGAACTREDGDRRALKAGSEPSRAAVTPSPSLPTSTPRDQAPGLVPLCDRGLCSPGTFCEGKWEQRERFGRKLGICYTKRPRGGEWLESGQRVAC